MPLSSESGVVFGVVGRRCYEEFFDSGECVMDRSIWVWVFVRLSPQGLQSLGVRA